MSFEKSSNKLLNIVTIKIDKIDCLYVSTLLEYSSKDYF